MEVPVVVIGIDIGEKTTDAVVVDKAGGKARVVAKAKTWTTADKTPGVKEAIRLALLKLEGQFTIVAVQQVNIGTSHVINALAQGKMLVKVSVIRLCGTASRRLPPFSDFPESVANAIKGSVFLTSGGYQCDGRPITKLDKSEILKVVETLKKQGECHIVISGIFSTIYPDQEKEVVKLIKEHFPGASITASHSVGKLGILERENTAILNECLKSVCTEAINEFRASLQEINLDCPVFLTLNDRTLFSKEMEVNCPLNTIGTGMANTVMGAAYLTGLKDALVLDIGESNINIGMLTKGSPRYKVSKVKIGGIRTKCRIPDVINTYVSGVTDKGKEETIQENVNVMHDMINNCIGEISNDDRVLPVILVGQDSIGESQKFFGMQPIIQPEYFDVAGAVGAALCQMGDTMNLDEYVTAACDLTLELLKNKLSHETVTFVKDKQTVTAIEKAHDPLVKHQTPNVNLKTGEWLLSEHDIECISIGTGILGSGGGGDPHLGKITVLRTLRSGKQPRVITPSKFYESADKENDLTSLIALLGAPSVLFEKLTAGNESKAALEALEELYNIGKYENGNLGKADDVVIKEEEGLTYVEYYPPQVPSNNSANVTFKIAALMPVEMGGMNSTEPLAVGAELDIPILDCDGMGRAFPEVPMFAPFIYGCNCFPSAIVDDKGHRGVVLKAKDPKHLEDCFRRMAIDMGGSAGVAVSHFTVDQIMKYTVKHTLSFAWRIGNAIIEARRENKSAVDELIKCTNGKLLISGKIFEVKSEIDGGFTKGSITIKGLQTFAGQSIVIDLKNEFVLACDEFGKVLACVPDLITVLDVETTEAVLPDELHTGMRVCAIAMPAPPLMTTVKALERVGPQAFGYSSDVKYEPVSSYPNYKPVGPM